MKFPRPIALVVAVALIAAVAIVASCSNNNNNGGILTPPAKELDSGNIPGGTNYVHKFSNTPGTRNYHCTIHGTGMAGSVIVVAGAPTTATVTIGPGNSYNPPSISVDTSGTVTWNNTGATHTVTSN